MVTMQLTRKGPFWYQDVIYSDVEITRCSIVKYCYVVTKVYGDYAITSGRTFSGTNMFFFLMYVEINRCSIVKYCYVVTKVYGDYAINSERTFLVPIFLFVR